MADGKPKVLVVDEDPLVARMLLECLRPLEVQAWAVHSGQEAVDEALATVPDLLIIETRLQDLDGFAVAARLKEDAATRHLPVIFVTAQARVEDRTRGLELGAADYITKPFYYDEVRARVAGVLQRAAARAAAATLAAAPMPAAGIQGRITEISVPNVVQMLEMERKTGTLELEQGPARGVLHFADGQIVDAAWKQHGGELAVFRLVRWTDGAFRFVPAADGAEPARHIDSSNQHLLMEAMRRLDEGERILAGLLPPDRPVRITARLQKMLGNRRPAADLKQILDLVDGRRTVRDILADLPDDLQALEVLARLKDHGFIEAA